MTWRSTRVAAATMAPGSVREVMLGVSSVLLVRLGPDVRATEAICPHEGGLLSDGTLTGFRISCPVHAAAFDVTTGRVLADPDGIEPPLGRVDPLLVYPTRVVAGMIEVDLP